MAGPIVKSMAAFFRWPPPPPPNSWLPYSCADPRLHACSTMDCLAVLMNMIRSEDIRRYAGQSFATMAKSLRKHKSAPPNHTVACIASLTSWLTQPANRSDDAVPQRELSGAGLGLILLEIVGSSHAAVALASLGLVDALAAVSSSLADTLHGSRHR